MRNRLIALPWLTLFAILSASKASAAPQRIVSLKPNITEILFAIGAGDRVVGVTTWCNYPPTVTDLPKVADYVAPNVEKVLALAPDLVIGSRENALRQPIEQLQSAGVPVALFPFTDVASTLQSIVDIGQRVGTRMAAAGLTERLRAAIAVLHAARRMQSAPLVLVVVGRSPLVSAGPHSFLGEVVTLAHGENIVTTTVTNYPRLSTETILAHNPEVIIDIAAEMGEGNNSWWQPYAAVDAIRHHRRLTLSTELFRPGPRLAEGLQAMGRAIHDQ